MELFIPGLATLLIVGLIVFLVLPRLGAPVLAALSIVLLAYGVYNHIQLFSAEYRYSTWQEQFKFYGPFVLVGGLILAILMYIGFLFGTEGASALPASSVPVANATEVVNSANNAVSNAVNTVTNTVSNAVNKVTNTLGFTNSRNNNMNKAGLLSNLGRILNTPNTRNNRIL
jgi:hypothetical protein